MWIISKAKNCGGNEEKKKKEKKIKEKAEARQLINKSFFLHFRFFALLRHEGKPKRTV